YKQWEFLDGPTYSVRKNEVFMVLYKNGKRETFEQTAPVQQARPQQQYNYPPQQNTNFDIKESEASSPTQEDLPEPKLSLSRVTLNMDMLSNDFLYLRLEYEYPLFKSRFFYWGFLGDYGFYTGEAEIDPIYQIGLSAAGRVPINYLTQQSPYLNGLVPYGKLNYITNFENGGFSFDTGVDWLFPNKKGGAFGISIFTTEFLTYSLGLAWTL
ncbi:MAG: hypothetical protein ACO1OQ_01885, partial [Rufibacter sp.]